MTAPPERIRWAVERLAPRPGDRILEIGMGRGASARYTLDSADVTYLGVDRSDVAVRATAERISEHIARGAASLLHRAIADVDPGEVPACDGALAVNINTFWTGPATAELRVLRGILGPRGGRLVLCYDVPGQGRAHHIGELVARHLAAEGLPATVEHRTAGDARLVLVTAAAPVVPGALS